MRSASERVLPDCWGHRGASASFPENTLASFEAAIRDGAEGIESDVHVSSDDVVIMFHDPANPRYLMLPQICPGPRIQLVLSKIERGMVKTPENQHVKFNVDVKPQNNPRRLFSLMHKIISVQSDWETKLAPRLVLGLWHPSFITAAKETLPYLTRSFIGISPSLARTYFWNHCDCFSMSFAVLATSDGEKFRKECQDAGKKLMVWTVNKPEHMMEAVRWGVDCILTDVTRTWLDMRSALYADYENVGLRYGRIFLWTTLDYWTPIQLFRQSVEFKRLQSIAGPFAIGTPVTCAVIEERITTLVDYIEDCASYQILNGDQEHGCWSPGVWSHHHANSVRDFGVRKFFFSFQHKLYCMLLFKSLFLRRRARRSARPSFRLPLFALLLVVHLFFIDVIAVDPSQNRSKISLSAFYTKDGDMLDMRGIWQGEEKLPETSFALPSWLSADRIMTVLSLSGLITQETEKSWLKKLQVAKKSTKIDKETWYLWLMQFDEISVVRYYYPGNKSLSGKACLIIGSYTYCLDSELARNDHAIFANVGARNIFRDKVEELLKSKDKDMTIWVDTLKKALPKDVTPNKDMPRMAITDEVLQGLESELSNIVQITEKWMKEERERANAAYARKRKVVQVQAATGGKRRNPKGAT
ncbi:PLC-like phosphodiesterase [Lentinula raphanica]|nr:PLC-like phosphodiesterase [Lentinula raphanica]